MALFDTRWWHASTFADGVIMRTSVTQFYDRWRRAAAIRRIPAVWRSSMRSLCPNEVAITLRRVKPTLSCGNSGFGHPSYAQISVHELCRASVGEQFYTKRYPDKLNGKSVSYPWRSFVLKPVVRIFNLQMNVMWVWFFYCYMTMTISSFN